MRHDLAATALNAAAAVLFADVLYTPVVGAAVRIRRAISGVEVSTEEVEYFGQSGRVGTHVTFAIAALFPALGKGDLLVELDRNGAPLGTYRVLDFKALRERRLKLVVALEAV